MTDQSANQPINEKTTSLPDDTLKTHLLIGLTASMTMMAEKVGELAVAAKTLTIRVEQGDEERKSDRRWFKLAASTIVGAFLVGGLIVNDSRQVTKDTAESLSILREATSPATAANSARNQQLLVNQIIEAVDCKNEENLRGLLESIRRGIPEVEIPEVRDVCREVRPVTPTSISNP